VARDRNNGKLLAALRAQDPAVARPLWRRFAVRTARVLQRILGPGARIEDIVPVVLLCVFERGARVRADADVDELVLKVTARVAGVELRRQIARAASRSPRDAITRFYRLLDRLSAADRVAFVFHHVENMDVRTVAAAIDGTVVATRRRLLRAAQRIRAGIARDPLLRTLG
jgi:DNA-directed RNA polymerase specialized sigma24 family protein